MTKNKKDVSQEKEATTETNIVLKNKDKSRKWLVVLSLFASFLLLVMVTFSAYLYLQIQTSKEQQALKTDQLTSSQKQFKEALSQSSEQLRTTKSELKRLTSQLQQVENENKLNKTDVQSLQRSFAANNVRHPNDWILAEVEYLVSLAGRKIWLEGDIKSSIALLLAADQRVVELNDASLSPLRAAFLEDINALEALPKRDPDGVVLALSSLERRINKLVIAGLTMPDVASNEETELSSDIHDWQGNLAKSWQGFVESFIVINKRDTKIEALLSPKQHWYLKENLGNSIAKAEFAVYREQQQVYDIALANASNLLKNYYDLNDSSTKHFYKSIQRLSKRKVSINYPSQLRSAPILERVIQERVNKSLVSSRLK